MCPSLTLSPCTGSARGPTGSTGRSRTMSTSARRTPCAPPLDLSEPRPAEQRPPLHFTERCGVRCSPLVGQPEKIRICFPSPLAPLSPSTNLKNAQGGWWHGRDRAGEYRVSDDGDDDDGDDVVVSHCRRQILPQVADVSPCTLSLPSRVFLKKTEQ